MTLSRFLRALRAYHQADARDAHLFNVYARMDLKPHARRMILSGLAGFQRTLEG